MKLLFDQNISYRITKKLQRNFSGCLHVSECNLSDSEDPEIWKFAKDNGHAIVTFDSDFYDISIINGHPPKIIWIRSGNLSTNEIVKLLIDYQLTIISFLVDKEYDEISCLELE